MATDRQPSFIVIGAVKAATTWIAYQLRQHPRLWLPEAEPHYFSDQFHRGFDWYRSLFEAAPPGTILGEKSADYLGHPSAAARIARTLPDARLIVQLRDPVERAYSDYCMLFRRGEVGRNLRHYLTHHKHHSFRFLNGGRYAQHLQCYLEYFRKEQLKILLYEDVCDRPEAAIAATCRHIGVETHLAPGDIKMRHNDSKAALLPLGLRRALRPVRPLLEPLRTVPWLARARSAIARPVNYPPMTDDLRATLRNFYRDDIHRLEDLIGRDLSIWTKTPGVEERSCA